MTEVPSALNRRLVERRHSCSGNARPESGYRRRATLLYSVVRQQLTKDMVEKLCWEFKSDYMDRQFFQSSHSERIFILIDFHINAD